MTVESTLDKKLLTEMMLSRDANATVLVHLDPRGDSVAVPPWLKHQAMVVLEFGHNMRPPITDFVIGQDGLRGTLSFSRTLFECFVPWSAVFAIIGSEGLGRYFTESMPTEVKAEVEKAYFAAKQLYTAAIKEPSARDAVRAAKRQRRVLPRGWSVIEGGGNGGGDDVAS